MKKTTFPLSVILFVVAIFTFSGCDQIKSIKEYFSGKNKETIEAVATNTEEAAVATEKQAVTNEAPVGPLPANVLARVGKWNLTVDEFNKRLDMIKQAMPEFDATSVDAKKTILEELLRQELVVKEAEQKGLDKTTDVKAAVEEFRKSVLVRQLLGQVAEGLTVSDEEITKFYNDNKDKLIDPGEWHLKEIAVADKAKADELHTQLVGGGSVDFAALAQANSVAPSASAGGDLGFVKGASEEPALAKLKSGEVSEVFQGPDGKFYIIKVEEQKPGKQLALEEIKEDIKQNILATKQQEKIMQYLKELETKLKLEVNPNLETLLK